MRRLLYILSLLLSITFSFAQTIVDQGVKEVTVDFPIGGITYSATPPPGRITITGSDGGGGTGSTAEYPGGKDYQFTDSNKIIWTVDENGTVTQGGKVAEGGASNSTNTSGVTGSGNNATVNQYTAKGIKIEWKENTDGQFAYDTAEKTKLPKDKYPSVKDSDNNTVYVPYKATVNKQTELFNAKVSITDPTLKDAKIIFKTLSIGKEIEATELNKTDTERNYQLKLVGAFDYAEEEVIAVLIPKDSKDKQQVISSFRLVHLSPKTVDVSLVPLDANSQSKLQSQGDKLNQIYKKIGINFNVKKESVLDIGSVVNGDTINSENADLMSTYSPQQQKINTLYKGTDARYVLFVTDKKSSTGQKGYMRLNGQFGYVYNNAQDKTGAHELGHGVFKLEHPWKSYGTTQSATPLLMDYSTGEELSHLDWKQINDPAFKLYAFQGQSSGEFSDIQLTPEWEPFKFTGSSIYISGDIKTPNGAVHGIAMCKNDNCSEREHYYWINDGTKKGYYANGISTPLSISYLTQQEKNKNPAVTLFWNYGSCGYNKTYSTTWNYIKDKKGFDLTKVTDENSIKYKETIPCVDGSGSTTSSEDTCIGKDVAQINQGYNKVLGIVDSKDSDLIVETINNVDVCSLRLLNYNEIEKLFKTLADDSNIGDNKEKAIVRLTASIKSENFKTFFTLLESNGNELIKNLMDKLHDTHFLYGENNYTNFVSCLLKMYKTNPESWVHYVKDENYFVDKIILANPIDKIKSFEQLMSGQATRSYNTYFINKDTGNVTIEQNVCKIAIPIGGTSNGVISICTPQPDLQINTTVSPLSPILVETSKELPIIKLALDLDDSDKKNTIIVPAIFLDYVQEKTQEDVLVKSAVTTLDVVTIATGTGVVFSAASKAKRVWALMEVAGAVGNIAVNTQSVSSETTEAINAYNAVMGIIGLKNLGKGGVKYLSDLPENVKNALQKNEGLRGLVKNSYLKFKSNFSRSKALGDYDELENVSKENLNKQERVLDDLVKETNENPVHFSQQQIDNYVIRATKTNPKGNKQVMLGKYDGGGETSYIKRAGDDYTYFNLGSDGWDDAYKIVQNDDEMWKINKQFLDEQKSIGCKFYYSHDPNNATGFMLREVDYIKNDLKAKKIEKINSNLWEVIW